MKEGGEKTIYSSIADYLYDNYNHLEKFLIVTALGRPTSYHFQWFAAFTVFR